MRRALELAQGVLYATSPNPRVVAQIRRFLERRYPVKSPFEL